MAEYWKSTPRYWCKHCSMYVRDTKLDRANHEATGKHRGGVERALRELHRGHERNERDKERARREIERLNGVVGGGSSSSDAGRSSSGGVGGGPSRPRPQPQPQQHGPEGGGSGGGSAKEQRQAQLEQLVAMGVSIPEELRGDLAMAGDWTVTKVRVVDPAGAGKAGGDGAVIGVRGKRDRDKTEDEVEAEEAAEGLFKRPRRWGREGVTSKAGGAGAGGDDDAELEALLGGDVVVKKKEEDGGEDGTAAAAIKKEVGVKNEGDDAVKKEEDEDQPAAASASQGGSVVKDEPRDEAGGVGPDVPGEPAPAAASGVVFKKRKPKNIRQR